MNLYRLTLCWIIQIFLKKNYIWIGCIVWLYQNPTQWVGVLIVFLSRLLWQPQLSRNDRKMINNENGSGPVGLMANKHISGSCCSSSIIRIGRFTWRQINIRNMSRRDHWWELYDCLSFILSDVGLSCLIVAVLANGRI